MLVRKRFILCVLPLVLLTLFIKQGDLFFDEKSVRNINFSQSFSNTDSFNSGAFNNLPKSLNLTHVDGQLEIDDEGNLIISGQIKNLFDYFLMTLGEENLDEILTRINAHLYRLQTKGLSDMSGISVDITNHYIQGTKISHNKCLWEKIILKKFKK